MGYENTSSLTEMMQKNRTFYKKKGKFDRRYTTNTYVMPIDTHISQQESKTEIAHLGYENTSSLTEILQTNQIFVLGKRANLDR